MALSSRPPGEADAEAAGPYPLASVKVLLSPPTVSIYPAGRPLTRPSSWWGPLTDGPVRVHRLRAARQAEEALVEGGLGQVGGADFGAVHEDADAARVLPVVHLEHGTAAVRFDPAHEPRGARLAPGEVVLDPPVSDAQPRRQEPYLVAVPGGRVVVQDHDVSLLGLTTSSPPQLGHTRPICAAHPPTKRALVAADERRTVSREAAPAPLAAIPHLQAHAP